MSLPIALVDAFTHTAFAGNPAGVCVLEREIPDDLMQRIANEMNQSETAFLINRGDYYSLRWFTPAVEVDLCGHATIASAHYLYTEQLADPTQTLVFETRSGRLTAAPVTHEGQAFIALDFPADPVEKTTTTLDLKKVLGAEPLGVYRGRFDYLVELESEDVVRNLKPDLLAITTLKARGIVVTSQANKGSELDFVSRGFFPQSGINEDSVTGSAHCMLAPFWGDRLGKTQMLGYQASARGGYVRMEVRGDRVHLLGNAVVMMKGTLLV